MKNGVTISEFLELVDQIEPSMKYVITSKPSRKAIKKLYQTIKHTKVNKETGQLEFDPRFPWSKFLGATLNALHLLDSEREKPITNQFDTDWLDHIAGFLSESKPIFVPRIWSSQIVTNYSWEYSIVHARDFVKANPEYTIQYGWVISRQDVYLLAKFTAAVRSPNGDVRLVQATPGAPFERAVAFVPDDKNKPDFANNSSPTLITMCMMNPSKFYMGTRERRLNRQGQIDYVSNDCLTVKDSSTLVRDGRCPQQPSLVMDLIGDTDYEVIRQRLKGQSIGSLLRPKTT